MSRFDPDWDRIKRERAAERREAERWLARNRNLQRAARRAELAEHEQHSEADLASLSEAMEAATDEHERRSLGRERNRVEARPTPPPRPVGDAGPTHVFGGASRSAWGRHQATNDAFERAYAARAAKKEKAEAERRRAGKKRLFSTSPAGFYGTGRDNAGSAPDSDARRAIRERFKADIAANEARMGKRARRERERRLARQGADRARRRREPQTRITKLGGRDLLVETSNPKALDRELRRAAGRGQQVSLMPRFSRSVRNKRSDGVVGQDDADVRLFGNGYDAQRLLDRVHNEYGGDFGRFCEDQARKTGVMGAVGLRSINLNVWDRHETSEEFEDDPIEDDYGLSDPDEYD